MGHKRKFVEECSLWGVATAPVCVAGPRFHFVDDAVGGADGEDAGVVGNDDGSDAGQRIVFEPVQVLFCGFDNLNEKNK